MRRAQIAVSLATIAQNARVLRAKCPKDTRMMAVVKADAYGHGACAVSKRLIDEHLVDQLAVAMVEEGVALRAAGISIPILVLGGSMGASLDDAVRHDITVAVYDADVLQALNRAAQANGIPAKAHIALDTGMARIGVRRDQALREMLALWAACPQVVMTGAFTHFCAVESDPAFTEQQNARFMQMIGMIRAQGFQPLVHAAASTAMLHPAYAHDMTRAGIALYGTGVSELAEALKPAQRLTARPVRIEWIQPGDTVGYDRQFCAQRATRVMTVPVGYGDGYPRRLSGRADVLVNGQRAPVIGNVCMDMLMADVTHVGEVTRDTEVVLLGDQGAERITPDELATLSGTIPYEIMLGFTARLTRVYA